MQSVKLAIAKQIESVKQRQEDAMKAQDELKDQIEIVGLDVESTRSNVAEASAGPSNWSSDLFVVHSRL